MSALLQVMLGGGLGAGARWLVGLALPFGWATLVVNVVGSFAMGLLFVTLAARNHPSALFLTTGVLGGFTTFSAFSLDTMKLIERGQMPLAFTYIAASVLLSLGACALAIHWGRT